MRVFVVCRWPGADLRARPGAALRSALCLRESRFIGSPCGAIEAKPGKSEEEEVAEEGGEQATLSRRGRGPRRLQVRPDGLRDEAQPKARDDPHDGLQQHLPHVGRRGDRGP